MEEGPMTGPSAGAMSTMSGMAQDTPSEGPIRDALGRAYAKAERLGRSIANLENRLHPALSPNRPDSVVPDEAPLKSVPHDPSEIYARVDELCIILATYTESVDRLNSRVDL